MNKSLLWLVLGLLLAVPALAAQETPAALTFLWLAVIIIFAKLASLVEKIGQPAVLGELIIGVILGNLALFGFTLLEPIKSDPIIHFLAELGVVILLFQIGLESSLGDMCKVGMRALLVACVGVIVPFVLGTYLLGPLIFKGLSSNSYLFLGATLTATSIGITGRVFKDLNAIKTPEAQIVLGAAVIDDVLGLIILAVVSAIVAIGAVSVGGVAWIITKAVLFLAGAIFIGGFAAPFISRGVAKIHAGVGMKFSLAICVALLFAYLANLIGLAPIVGAFAAGLVLEPVHFKYFKDAHIVAELKEHISKYHRAEKHLIALAEKHADRHIDELIEPIALFFVPVFFVVTGMSVDLATLANPVVLLGGLGLTVIAVAGKIVSGLVAGPVNKLIVGFGMVPRGEVGLIFATIGKGLGVIPDAFFSIIIIMIVATTFITPPILAWLIKRSELKKK